MEKQPSWPIKIAAFLLLVGGLFGLLVAVSRLTVSVSNPRTAVDLRGAINQFSQIISIGWGAASILAGWFLMKLKRWAYVLSLVLVSLASLMHLLVIVQVGTARYYSFVLSLAILIVLIVGKKDFKRQQNFDSSLNSV